MAYSHKGHHDMSPGDRPKIDDAHRLDAVSLDFIGFQDSCGLVVHFAVDCRKSLVPVFAFLLQLVKFHFVELESQLGFILFGKYARALVFDNATHRFSLLSPAVAEDFFGGSNHGIGTGPEVRAEVIHILRRGFLQLSFDGFAYATGAGRFECLL